MKCSQIYHFDVKYSQIYQFVLKCRLKSFYSSIKIRISLHWTLGALSVYLWIYGHQSDTCVQKRHRWVGVTLPSDSWVMWSIGNIFTPDKVLCNILHFDSEDVVFSHFLPFFGPWANLLQPRFGQNAQQLKMYSPQFSDCILQSTVATHVTVRLHNNKGGELVRHFLNDSRVNFLFSVKISEMTCVIRGCLWSQLVTHWLWN